ncbi:hypothetical protein GCM10010341_72670 [Streptomyces noursei]|nr:hypothetical protein GCM10010341_72670 [Streptomyces noursei]
MGRGGGEREREREWGAERLGMRAVAVPPDSPRREGEFLGMIRRAKAAGPVLWPSCPRKGPWTGPVRSRAALASYAGGGEGQVRGFGR